MKRKEFLCLGGVVAVGIFGALAIPRRVRAEAGKDEGERFEGNMVEAVISMGDRSADKGENEVVLWNMAQALINITWPTGEFKDGKLVEAEDLIGGNWGTLITLEPGGDSQFRFNRQAGKFTQGNGFKSIDGVEGAGVSQLASLINWAVIEANKHGAELDISQTTPRDRGVPGIPKAAEIAIDDEAQSGSDLVITNQGDETVEILIGWRNETQDIAVMIGTNLPNEYLSDPKYKLKEEKPKEVEVDLTNFPGPVQNPELLGLKPDWVEAPKMLSPSERMISPKVIILHWSVGSSVQQTHEYIGPLGLSCQFAVGRDKRTQERVIYQMQTVNNDGARYAHCAGIGVAVRFSDNLGEKTQFTELVEKFWSKFGGTPNDYSLQVEIDGKYFDKTPPPPEDVQNIYKLVAWMMQTYNIPLDHVTGHLYFNDHKMDPGVMFLEGIKYQLYQALKGRADYKGLVDDEPVSPYEISQQSSDPHVYDDWRPTVVQLKSEIREFCDKYGLAGNGIVENIDYGLEIADSMIDKYRRRDAAGVRYPELAKFANATLAKYAFNAVIGTYRQLLDARGIGADEQTIRKWAIEVISESKTIEAAMAN